MKKLQRKSERFKGVTLGLDVHKHVVQWCVLDASGDERENASMRSGVAELEKLLDRLTAGGVALQASLEASGCFIWAYRVLVAKLGKDRVHVAAPSKVRVIAEAGEKTDATDAWWLADLLYEGRLPEAFVAEGDLRELRIACRERRSIVEERSDLMRRLRSHLTQVGVELGKSDFKSAAGRARIAAVVADVLKKEGQLGMAASRLWRRIGELDLEIGHWDEQVSLLAGKFPQIKLMDEELAGVGEQIAATVYSELGHPGRYRNAKALAKATGLTPGYRESAGKRSRGSITREGSAHVRWALTRAVIACLRCKQGSGAWVRRWVMHQRKRKPMKVAVVAAARKLAEGLWRLFALGESFDLARSFGSPARATGSPARRAPADSRRGGSLPPPRHPPASPGSLAAADAGEPGTGGAEGVAAAGGAEGAAAAGGGGAEGAAVAAPPDKHDRTREPDRTPPRRPSIARRPRAGKTPAHRQASSDPQQPEIESNKTATIETSQNKTPQNKTARNETAQNKTE